MFLHLKAWLSLPIYKNEEDRRVARVLLVLVLFFLLTGVSLIITGWFWGAHTYTLTMIVGCSLQIFILAFIFRGNLTAAGYALVLIYIFFTTMSATVGNGIHDYSIMGYPLIVVFSGLAEKQRGLIVSTALILLSLVWLIYGEMSGWFAGHPFLPITWLDLLINAVIIVLVAVEVNMLVVNWNDRLAQTSRELVERRQIEQALSQSREMYRLLAENISDVIWVFDVNENRTRYISPSVERLRGYTAEEVLAGDMSKALTPASLRDVLEKISLRIKAFHEGCRGSYVDELEQLCKDGSTVWTEVTTRFHLNEDNGHVEMYGVSRGISERKRSEKLLLEANEQLRMRVEEIELLQAELREQIIRDPMTGLYNRRYMNDLFIREFSRAARENYALSVIMLDMDDLKMINDTYGHHIGDAAIQALASCLKSLTRIADVACRYGGDEFTIVMAKTSTEDAVRRIEEWREFLSARPVEVDAAHRVAVKFTAGIASFPTHGTSMEEIINYADIALYRAKARGRDCTAVFE